MNTTTLSHFCSAGAYTESNNALCCNRKAIYLVIAPSCTASPLLRSWRVLSISWPLIIKLNSIILVYKPGFSKIYLPLSYGFINSVFNSFWNLIYKVIVNSEFPTILPSETFCYMVLSTFATQSLPWSSTNASEKTSCVLGLFVGLSYDMMEAQQKGRGHIQFGYSQ